MPTPTFERLKQERKAKILSVSLTEFALHEYESASVSRIVKQLGISSNGTFFRYFSNKKSLYFWLMQMATEKKLAFLQDSNNQITNLKGLLQQQFYQKVDFDLRYPLYGQFLNNSLQERSSQDLGNLQQTTLLRYVDLNQRLLAPFVELGQIRQSVDLRKVAFAIVQHQNSLLDLIALEYQLDIPTAILKGQNLPQIERVALNSLIADYVSILIKGIEN